MATQGEEPLQPFIGEGKKEAFFDSLLEVLMLIIRAASREVHPKQALVEDPLAVEDVRRLIRHAPLRTPTKPNPPPKPVDWQPPLIAVRELKRKKMTTRGKPRQKPASFNFAKTLETLEPPYDGRRENLKSH